MRFRLQTLVDITKTNARFNKIDPKWHQQQNYLTVIQTLGLRVNPIIEATDFLIDDVKKYNFGSNYKGKNRVWTINFRIEYENGLTVDNLKNDFHYIPIIIGLDETVKFEKNLFVTDDSADKNIVFCEVI